MLALLAGQERASFLGTDGAGGARGSSPGCGTELARSLVVSASLLGLCLYLVERGPLAWRLPHPAHPQHHLKSWLKTQIPGPCHGRSGVGLGSLYFPETPLSILGLKPGWGPFHEPWPPPRRIASRLLSQFSALCGVCLPGLSDIRLSLREEVS